MPAYLVYLKIVFAYAAIAGVNAALGAEGRKHRIALSATEKRVKDSFEYAVTKLQHENETLQSVIDELAADDEDRTRLVALLRNNKEIADDLEKKVKAYEPKIAKAEDWELTEMCNEVAKDYDAADAARLKRQAARTRFSDTEERIDQIREIAEDFGWKKKTESAFGETKEPPRKLDSGVTTGKTGLTIDDVRKMSPEEKNRRYKEIAAIPFS